MTRSTGRDEVALRDLLLNNQRSGARRRAAMLHTDRLSSTFGKAHHIRLARDSLSGLAFADRAQSFELSRGRLVIVWRSNGGDELAQARQSLEHLLAGQAETRPVELGELLTVYDLPEQVSWLLDEIFSPDSPSSTRAGLRALDAHHLACLEASLGHADLTRFARWRPVSRLSSAPFALAWEERYFSIQDIAATLCPEFDIRSDSWLFQRLTRTLDRRMLAMLGAPGALRNWTAFSINLNTETILSEDFVKFDEGLPLTLRGNVMISLGIADIVSDAAGFNFARRFVQGRGYRLALRGATPAVIRCVDMPQAGFDDIHITYSIEQGTNHLELAARLPTGTRLIATGLDRPSELLRAIQDGFAYGSGRAIYR